MPALPATPAAPSVPATPAVPALAKELAARATEAEPGYTLVLLKTGPKSGKLSKEENDQAFAGHFSNMQRMAEARELVVAGPFGAKRHDDALRGVFVMNTAERAKAEVWAGTDPATRAGVFVLEFHDLATRAPFLRALEEDIAWRKDQEAQGRTPSGGEGARPYVLLTAEDGARAERELAPLVSADGGVFFVARLDGTRAFALLEAADVDEARERFAPQLDNLGAHVLDEWFASKQLARLPEL
jgi:uncharacterized protein YciI